MAASPSFESIDLPSIINDFYSLEDYVCRRGCYLGRHPDYQHSNSGLFKMARDDAGHVFRAQTQALSVQEVRRREYAMCINPVLPLPTTSNTETLDDFASYADGEWTPGTVWPDLRKLRDVQRIGDEADAAADVAMLSQTASTSGDEAWYVPARPMTQAANTHTNLTSLTQTSSRSMSSPTTKRNSLSSSQPLIMSSSSPTSGSTSTDATTQESGDFLPTVHHDQKPRDLLKDVITALGQSPGERTGNRETLALIRDPRVASLAGRGIKVPVKESRGRKRSASGISSLVTTSAGSEPDAEGIVQPPIKKLMLKTSKQPATLPSTAFIDKASVKKASKAISKSSSSHKKPSSGTGGGLTKREMAVIAGAALPKTKLEASQASTERHERLLARHTATAPRKGRELLDETPDLLPEFFELANFSPGQEEDSVRCVCGVTRDDNQRMICCDKCSVWQHIKCMGEAVPKNIEGKEYRCQVCDPWAHRRLIAELRKANLLE